MKLAVVGSGVAGLVAAWRLSQQHDVTVFEAEDRVGGHIHTHTVEDPSGPLNVDTGFIVFNERTYPRFIRLLDELGVASGMTSMSFSVTNQRSGLEYCGTSLNTLFAQRRNLLNPGFLRLLTEIVRFNRRARVLIGVTGDGTSGTEHDWTDGADDGPTLGAFLKAEGFSDRFAENYIVGMGAAIWSCPADQMLEFPARSFVRFFHNHGLLNVLQRPKWRVVKGGSARWAEALCDRLPKPIRTGTPVRRIERTAESVVVQLDGSTETFDGVVLACHSDEALALLADPSELENAVLGAIRYQRNEVVLHTDERLLPASQRAWAAWNYRVGASGAEADVQVTYNMNILQSLTAERTWCVTLNETDAIDPAKVERRLSYAHPVFDAAAVAAQRSLGELNGQRNTWYCGAWCRHGFHEDGVVSALSVASELGDSW